ncbi:MAG: hypothetical protein K9I29_10115, partial [Bacteroidales bacterium]|nr:hypothetical protein [Bacteroidales bacterium]
GFEPPEATNLNGFQDRRNRPLCHVSGAKVITFLKLPIPRTKKSNKLFALSCVSFNRQGVPE